MPVTPAPTASTTPAASEPGVYGSFGPRLSVFERRYVSTGFTPTARLRTRIWFGPGAGVGTSSSFSTEGPPYCETRMAFMGNGSFVRRLAGVSGPENTAREVSDATAGASHPRRRCRALTGSARRVPCASGLDAVHPSRTPSRAPGDCHERHPEALAGKG